LCVIVCESDEAYAMECAARCSLLVLRGDAFVPWWRKWWVRWPRTWEQNRREWKNINLKISPSNSRLVWLTGYWRVNKVESRHESKIEKSKNQRLWVWLWIRILTFFDRVASSIFWSRMHQLFGAASVTKKSN
jgi:hypothetical protein